ncbi:MAG: alpha/beta hydrolase [Hyphomicrobiales bacterium]|nr:alpha/beta hydrolase [Hyphomicrobiales bacterium]
MPNENVEVMAREAPVGDASDVVWRGLTREELQRQFDMRLAVPEGQDFPARYLSRSEAARGRLVLHQDIRYGAQPRQLLDIFPAAAAAAPVVMFWHGGAWRYQSKDHFSYVAEPLVAAGITTMLVGYDLHPDVSLRQMMVQACEAIVWTWRNIAAYASDPGRVIVSGHSAGAQLAGMALAHDFSKDGLPRSPVRGAFLISGSYDMEPHRHHERYRDMGLDEDLVRDASPACNPPLDPDLPLVLAAGGAETPGYIWQAQSFCRKCCQRGHPAGVLLSPGDHHFSVIERLAEPDHELTRALIGLAQQHE